MLAPAPKAVKLAMSHPANGNMEVPDRQLTTPSDTVPALFTATSQTRPGVLVEKPSVEFAGTVTDSAEVTSTNDTAPLAAVAERNMNHTGSVAEGVAPANVWMLSVSAPAAAVATICPLSMLKPSATAEAASIDALMVLAAPISAPPSVNTLPEASANVATWPAVEEPGPVTFPEPTGGWMPAAAGSW